MRDPAHLHATHQRLAYEKGDPAPPPRPSQQLPQEPRPPPFPPPRAEMYRCPNSLFAVFCAPWISAQRSLERGPGQDPAQSVGHQSRIQPPPPIWRAVLAYTWSTFFILLGGAYYPGTGWWPAFVQRQFGSGLRFGLQTSEVLFGGAEENLVSERQLLFF